MERSEKRLDELKGFVTVASVCAESLVNKPDEGILSNVRIVAEALGYETDCIGDAGAGIEQRYYDRFFVSSHPAYVPLFEDSVRGGYEEGGKFRYAPTEGRYFDHVLKCYQSIGFDYKLIEGFDLAVQKLKADSMASELAFMVYLARAAVEFDQSDAAVSSRAEELLVQFAREHASRWFPRAAECLDRFEHDAYALIAAMAADAVEAIAGQPAR